jgi:hypothetical protein
MENLDEEKFVKEFAKATLKGWSGLTIEHLETLILINTDGQEPDAEVEFSEDNAEILVTNSTEFDTWLNEVVFDLENFRGDGKKTSSRKAGKDVQKS